MNLKALGIFKRNKITATPVTITQAPDSSGVWVDTETLGDSIVGVKWNISNAEKYYNRLWAADITEVFATYNPGDIQKDSKLRIDGVDYYVDGPVVNVQEQGDVYLIGLRRSV